MMNVNYAYRGFFIAAELDLDGKPTGFFLVISSGGAVMTITSSFAAAKGWIDVDLEKQEAAAREQLDLSCERGG